MLEQRFKELFDAIEPSPALLERTERSANDMTREEKRAITVRSAILVTLAVALLVGTALAVTIHSDILDRLFRGGQVPEQVGEALVTHPASVTKDGITLCVDEYLTDEAMLHCGWTVSSQRGGDVYYLTEYALRYADGEDATTAEESAGGLYGTNTSSELGDAVMVRLNAEHPRHSGWLDDHYVRRLQNPVTMALTVRAFESALTPVDVEDSLPLIYPEEGETLIARLEGRNEIGVDAEDLTCVANYSAVQRALSEESEADYDEQVAKAIVASGLMRPVTTLELEVTIQPDQAALTQFTLDAPRVFQLPDRTVTLRTLNIHATSTQIQYLVTSDAPLGDADEFEKRGLRYLIFDQEGRLLNVDCALNTAAEYTPEGVLVTMEGNPIPEGVTVLRFVPTCALEREPGESSNAYYARMAARADAFECLTVALRDTEG